MTCAAQVAEQSSAERPWLLMRCVGGRTAREPWRDVAEKQERDPAVMRRRCVYCEAELRCCLQLLVLPQQMQHRAASWLHIESFLARRTPKLPLQQGPAFSRAGLSR